MNLGYLDTLAPTDLLTELPDDARELWAVQSQKPNGDTCLIFRSDRTTAESVYERVIADCRLTRPDVSVKVLGPWTVNNLNDVKSVIQSFGDVEAMGKSPDAQREAFMFRVWLAPLEPIH